MAIARRGSPSGKAVLGEWMKMPAPMFMRANGARLPWFAMTNPSRSPRRAWSRDATTTQVVRPSCRAMGSHYESALALPPKRWSGTPLHSSAKQRHNEGAMYSWRSSTTLAMWSKSWSAASTVASFTMEYPAMRMSSEPAARTRPEFHKAL
jgi:hypothetical protein